jgi:putative molybdopterin biosynthesis protein
MALHKVQLHYSLADAAQSGARLDSPLFDLLSALHNEGSIQRAATASGASYRHVWGALKRWEQALGAPLVSWIQGQPARLTPLAERLLWGERLARARQAAGIGNLRAELERVLVEAGSGPLPALTVAASPEPLLPALRELARQAHGLHLDLQPDTSFGALRALAEGRCGVAAVHRPPATTPFDAAIDTLLRGGHTQLCRVQRRHGLMVPRGNPQLLQVVAGLSRRGLRCVLRPPGSGTLALLQQLLQQQGLALADLQTVTTEPSHEAAAVAVAAGCGDAALGTEAAAHAAGLDFVPVAQDDWCLFASPAALATSAGGRLAAALQAGAWREAMAALPGHTLAAVPAVPA